MVLCGRVGGARLLSLGDGTRGCGAVGGLDAFVGAPWVCMGSGNEPENVIGHNLAHVRAG